MSEKTDDTQIPKDSKPRKYVSKKNQSRGKTRQDNYRKSPAFTSGPEKEIRDLIDKTLFFGFSTTAQASTAVQFTPQRSAVVLPVTTRAVGIYTQQLFIKSHQSYRNIPVCSPHAFYRVALAQVELKLLESSVRHVSTGNLNAQHLFYRPRMSNDFKDLTRSVPLQISPMANLIHAIGNFEYNQKCYYVRPVAHPLLGIVLSNLRRVVTEMADPLTDVEDRTYFYNNNPLPFSMWTNVPEPRPGIRRRRDGAAAADNNHPLLLNADEIMPAVYTVEDFEDDINHVQNMISFLGRKNSALTSAPCVIDYNGVGHKRILTSNFVRLEGGVWNPPCTRIALNAFGAGPANQVFDYANCPGPTGDLDEFWSPECIDGVEMFMGALNLLGEIPETDNIPRAFSPRSDFGAVMRANHRYVALLQNMMG